LYRFRRWEGWARIAQGFQQVQPDEAPEKHRVGALLRAGKSADT
jgi:hypothetical protein